MPLAPGTRLLHFEILAPIGAGGMGEVYRARDTRLGREVAIKVLPEARALDPSFRARFEREARAVAALSHPNILALYDVGAQDDTLFAVMELVDGDTLRLKLDSGRLDVESALSYALQIARGLAAAHDRGIVHRDLKPENVMIARGDHVKILDFGLAKAVESSGPAAPPMSRAETRSGELTQQGSVVGTTAYMSPEQVRGQPLDARSDLFSLGVLLYEALTGRHPFRGPTPMDTMSAILKDQPEPASAVNAGVPLALQAVVEGLLAKEPAGRPASAAAVAEELEQAARAPQPTDPAASSQPRRSIAVLPFVDMSPAKDQDYLCEGIAEELINALAHVEGLRVAARTSAFRFKGKAEDVRRIGQQLGVESVLEGSVRKAGDRLRLTAQLVSAKDGYHLWSERYDRDVQDVFALQDEIAATIVETLKMKLAPAGQAGARRAPENVEAYQLYLQGRYFWNKRHEGGLWKSVEFFEQAIAMDPGYALAHAGLADAYSVIGFYAFIAPRDAFAKAKQAAERALRLDPRLAEAHVSLALVRFWFEWDWPGAEREFRESLALAPQQVIGRIFLGQLLAALGRVDEAEPEWQAAIERDPLSPLTHGLVGSGRHFARRYEAGLASCRRGLEIDPNHVQSVWASASNLDGLGRVEEALDAARRAAALGSRAPIFLGLLGQLCGISGRRDEALVLLAELEKRSAHEYVGPLFRAWILAGLRERDRTLDLLEQAYEERNSMMITLATMPQLEYLAADPRFQALLARMKLTRPGSRAGA